MLHDYIPSPKPTRPLEFAVPPNMSAAGELAIECRQPPGAAQVGGSGRGCLVSEIWLTPTL